MKTILCLLAGLFAVLFVGCKSERAASKSNQGINLQTETGDINLSGDTDDLDVSVEDDSVSIEGANGDLSITSNENGMSVVSENNTADMSITFDGNNVDVKVN